MLDNVVELAGAELVHNTVAEVQHELELVAAVDSEQAVRPFERLFVGTQFAQIFVVELELDNVSEVCHNCKVTKPESPHRVFLSHHSS